MTYVHIYAPQPTMKWVHAGTCPDCKLWTRFLCFHMEYLGTDETCIRCGREWQDGEWMDLPFIPQSRQLNVVNAKNRFRFTKLQESEL